jgi:hypothetical protein
VAVAGIDGREWTVRREWIKRMPRWRAAKRKFQTGLDGGDGVELGVAALDDFPALAFAVGVVVALFLLWFFIIPALIFIGDLLFLVFVAAVGIALRVLFKRPWKVVAETDGPPAERCEFPVVGFRASGKAVHEIEVRIQERGHPMGG